jgi:hypothetical protein
LFLKTLNASDGSGDEWDVTGVLGLLIDALLV